MGRFVQSTSGLGYKRIGDSPGGLASAQRWNAKSAANRAGTSNQYGWSVKRGGKYSGPDDAQLALDLWRLQHEGLECSGSGDPNDRSAPDECPGRDGRFGQQAEQIIANRIILNDALGRQWKNNLNINQALISRGTRPIPSLRASDVPCSRRRVAGLPACPREPSPPKDPCAGVRCTGGKKCVNGRCVSPADPCAACTPSQRCVNGRCVAPKPSPKKKEAGGAGLLVAGVLLLGGAWWWKKKKG